MIRTLLAAALALVAMPLVAATPYMVKDLETTTGPRGSFTSLSWMWPSAGPVVYFVADDDTGAQLWTTDGTTLRAVTRGADLRNSVYLGQLGRTVIYALRGTIYASDGNAPVALTTVANGSETIGWAVFKNHLYFTATRSDVGTEIFRTDGTPAGTIALDVNPGPASSNSHSFAASGDVLYFFGRTPAGQGLHRSDGTVGGTSMVSNVDSPDPGTVALGNGKIVFFTVDQPGQTSTLWVSDGTAAGTTHLRGGFTETADEYAMPLAVMNNRMLFSAEEPNAGSEVWITDGTIAGTHLLHDIDPGPVGSLPTRGARVGDRYFFAAYDSDDNLVLYTTNGTTSGLTRVMVIGTYSRGVFAAPAAINNRLVFVRRDDVHGSEFWSSDGTAAGTQLLADIHAGPISGYNGTAYARLPNALVFRANDEVHGTEPYITDGTPAGTRLLADLAPDLQYSFNPTQFAASGSRLFFASDSSGRIAVSDGTANGTRSINIGTSSDTRFVEGVVSNGLYFFVTRRAVSGGNFTMTVWRSDGTDAGTFSLYQHTLPDTPVELVPFGKGVLFAGYDTTAELEPWFSDGTPGGTKRLRDLDPTNAARQVPVAHVHGGSAWIGYGRTLWKSDATESGTIHFATLEQTGAVIQRFASAGSTLYFTTGSPSALWRTDGTAAGTRIVKTLDAPAAHLHAAGNLLFFSVARKMWRSDGTSEGTFALNETDAIQCDTTSLASFGNTVYWLTSTSLWRSDGTTAGTTRVATFSRTGCENALVAHERRLYFGAETAGAGDELWTSDGTSAGTRVLADIDSGSPSSRPRELTVTGDRLFFAATTSRAGRELWAYDVPRGGKGRAVRH